MNIQKTTITQVVLVPFDKISLDKLIPQQRLEPLVSLFGFRNAEISKSGADQVSVTLEHGIYDNDTGSHAVKKLEIRERKIVFSLEGTSQDAEGFFEELDEFLMDLSDIEGHLSPVLKSQESEIIAKLDFSIEDLLSPAYLAFVRTAVERETSLDIAEASVRPVALKFRVDYLLQDESIQEQNISLSSKEFSVEPRKGTLLADRIFYSKAPLDTDAHARLLEELEATLSQ